MTPDLKSIKAAAERVIEWEYGSEPSHGHPYVMDDHMEGDDAGILATFALAQIAALEEQGDGEVIPDLDWLATETGFDMRNYMKCQDGDHIKLTKQNVAGWNVVIEPSTRTSLWNCHSFITYITTRRQCRQLLEALGIQRKDGE